VVVLSVVVVLSIIIVVLSLRHAWNASRALPQGPCPSRPDGQEGVEYVKRASNTHDGYQSPMGHSWSHRLIHGWYWRLFRRNRESFFRAATMQSHRSPLAAPNLNRRVLSDDSQPGIYPSANQEMPASWIYVRKKWIERDQPVSRPPR